MDPSNGDVLAAANGADYQDTKFNIATDGQRQEGSTYKAITLATALENGFSPKDTIDGSDYCQIPGYETSKQGVGRNASDGEGGVNDLSTQTADSVNCAFLRLQQAVGSDKVADMAVKLGIRKRPTPLASLTLGTVEATPLEMATVYNTFAADGMYHEPVFIKRIENTDGKVLYENDPAGTRVISAQTARTVTRLLEGVIQHGTGTRADIGRPAAGKTGTTDDRTDAWFNGYVPQLTAAVWMGVPGTNAPMGSIGQFSSIFGGTYPALIWHNFMTAALDGQPELAFAKPDESLWPAGKFITVKGRGVNDPSARSFDTPETTVPDETPAAPPASAPPATTPTVPPATTPTTAPVPPGP
jgi:penicillin-binding protein 1A